MSEPSVTVVFLVYNRREELRESLERMHASDYGGEVDYIVVDNASTDGSGDMVRADFPDVRLLTHAENVGVSGWNIGFAEASGDWVLALDDDCYLPPDGLRRSIEAAQDDGADMVSYKVRSTKQPDHYFDVEWWAGLFGFWGCAVLFRGAVIKELEGYDPWIFLHSNETELAIRLIDRGYRHLHLPDVVAEHMKAPPQKLPYDQVDYSARGIHNRHHGYTVGKLLRLPDGLRALAAMIATDLRDGFRYNWRAATHWHNFVIGFAAGLRRREPVRPEVSRLYRENFWLYAGPWRMSRPPLDLVRGVAVELARGRVRAKERPPSPRREEYFAARARYYPEGRGALSI